MTVHKPPYFDAFRCAAGACPDSCCQEWDVQIDRETAARYQALPGALGDRLREVLRVEDGQTYMTIQDGRCPMWRPDGLCRIQAELGEAALCRTCREFPRLTHDYGDFVELGLELSCPEAAKLILNAKNAPMVVSTAPGGEAEYDQEAMGVLKATRKAMLELLSSQSRPVAQTLALGLMYGVHAQALLDGGEEWSFSPEAALASARSLALPGDFRDALGFFENLEILTGQWTAQLHAPAPAPWEPGHLALARYLVERYWLQAVADYDLYGRVKFILISCLLVRTLGGDLIQTAQLFSKEIENDVDNVDAILDGAYRHPAFSDRKLLGALLG